nr:MAG TPA: hypothetical protein [Caudoviricetes sp.]
MRALIFQRSDGHLFKPLFHCRSRTRHIENNRGDLVLQ